LKASIFLLPARDCWHAGTVTFDELVRRGIPALRPMWRAAIRAAGLVIRATVPLIRGYGG